ncbi:hypothetical protein Tco_1523572 [Tanacetum coccineum]
MDSDHRVAYEALQDSIRHDECEDFDVDKAQEETKKKSKQDSLKTLHGSPPSPPSSSTSVRRIRGLLAHPEPSILLQAPPHHLRPVHQSGEVGQTSIAAQFLKDNRSAEYSAWTTTDTRIKPSITTIPDDLYMDDETTADEQAYSSGEETTYVPPPKNSLLAQTGDIATFMDWNCKQQGISELTPKDLEGPAYEIVKQATSTWCEPCQLTIQSDFFFNKDLEYLRYGRKIGRPALSIAKMKAVFYPDVVLEQLVPDQFWIEEECKYDIALNLTKPRWDAIGFEFKHDYTVIDSPRAVTFKDRYGVQMIMRENPGMIKDFGRRKERRCQKQGVHVRYPERLKTRRIFWNFWSAFLVTDSRRRLPVMERTNEGNWVIHMLSESHGLIANMRTSIMDNSDTVHTSLRSVLTDPEDQVMVEMEIPRSSGVNSQPHAHT